MTNETIDNISKEIKKGYNGIVKFGRELVTDVIGVFTYEPKEKE